MIKKKEIARGPILVVDSSEGIRSYLFSLLKGWGYDVELVSSGEQAIEFIEERGLPGLVLLDLLLPGMSGFETLRQMRKIEEMLPIVILSVVSRVPIIVDSMKAGAADFISKPFEEDELQRIVARLLPLIEYSDVSGTEKTGAQEYIWDSPSMVEIRNVIEQISDTDVTVLIQGESGVGKEVVARSIHNLSSRKETTFVKVNCAALPEDLLESELFGYEKGAFTGANARKIGKFEVADGGTIFLDEIGEMSPALQAKLLQVLQDRSFSRLGGNREISVDIRIVCATHRTLTEMVLRNTFRKDLYFRLNVVSILIPPLRDQREMIPKLIESFLSRYKVEYRRPHYQISEQLMRSFSDHSFPGNIRELENMIKRTIVLASEESVLTELSKKARFRRGRQDEFRALLEEVEESAGAISLREVSRLASLQVEREAIDTALHQTGWNRKQAAQLLGVSYKTLLQKIRDCELTASG